jgi:hypothetical protein
LRNTHHDVSFVDLASIIIFLYTRCIIIINHNHNEYETTNTMNERHTFTRSSRKKFTVTSVIFMYLLVVWCLNMKKKEKHKRGNFFLLQVCVKVN